MNNFHRAIAYAIPAAFALLVLLAIVVYLRNREPGRFFYGLLATVQGILVVQAIVGVVLLLMGRFPNHWLHFVYGAGFPLVVLFYAHQQARKRPGLEAAIFGVAAFLCAFSSWRAWITGPPLP
jgi:hypothetical protein